MLPLTGLFWCASVAESHQNSPVGLHVGKGYGERIWGRDEILENLKPEVGRGGKSLFVGRGGEMGCGNFVALCFALRAGRKSLSARGASSRTHFVVLISPLGVVRHSWGALCEVGKIRSWSGW